MCLIKPLPIPFCLTPSYFWYYLALPSDQLLMMLFHFCGQLKKNFSKGHKDIIKSPENSFGIISTRSHYHILMTLLNGQIDEQYCMYQGLHFFSL